MILRRNYGIWCLQLTYFWRSENTVIEMPYARVTNDKVVSPIFCFAWAFFSGRRKIPAKMSWMNTVWRTITNTSDLRGVQKVWIPLFGPRQTPVQLRPRISDMKMKYPATTFSFFTGHNDEEVNKIITRTRLPSVGFRSWSRFLAVNLQVT